MTRRIAFVNEKGGVGKSTTAINVAATLALKYSQKVLVVDCDPQANATSVFTGRMDFDGSVGEVLMNRRSIQHSVYSSQYPKLEILPAKAHSLADVNVELASVIGREHRMARALETVDHVFDYVIADCGPTRTIINLNVLNYVEEVIVPIDPGVWSLDAFRSLYGVVEEVRTGLQHEALRISGVVLTRFKVNQNVSKDVEKIVRDQLGDLVFKTVIPENVKLEESHSRAVAAIDYAPDCAGSVAYMALTEEIVNQATENEGEPAETRRVA